MNTEKEYVLEMKDITKHYGENTVLNGVSLSVKKVRSMHFQEKTEPVNPL